MESPESLPSEAAEKIILWWDSTMSEEARGKMIFEGDRQEVDRYLQAVDEIQRSTYSDDLNKMAMARLQLEFRNILISRSYPIQPASLTEPTQPDSTFSLHSTKPRNNSNEMLLSALRGNKYYDVDEILRINSSSSRATTISIRQIDLIPSDATYDLRCIAERMISSGYLRECVEVYGSVRKSAVDASFQSLGIEKLSVGDVHRLGWDQLQPKVSPWIRASKFFVRTLFPSEKKLCQQIFDGVGTDIDDACFMETVKETAIQLFSFAEGICLSRRSHEKFFTVLNLYDALMDLIHDIYVVFGSRSSESIRIQVYEILSRLADAAREMLFEFEDAVLRDPSKVVPGGSIHPLTRYVMKYIISLSNYKQAFNELIVDKPIYSAVPSTLHLTFAQSRGKTPFGIHLIWICEILQFNLDGKSKQYKDESLSHLFMMNNVHHMDQEARNSHFIWSEMTEYGYLKKLTENFEVEATCCKQAILAELLYCLREEGLHVSDGFSSRVSKGALRERFKAFNAMFTKVRRTQAAWVISHSDLRVELRRSISEMLIPAYESFLGRYRSHTESGKHSGNYIKYSGEDLKDAVSHFFERNRFHIPIRLRWRSQRRSDANWKLGHSP